MMKCLAVFLCVAGAAHAQTTTSIDLIQPSETLSWQDAAGNKFTIAGSSTPVKVGTLTIKSNSAYPQTTQSIDLMQPTFATQTWQDAAGNSFTLTSPSTAVKYGTLTIALPTPALATGTYNFTDAAKGLAIDDWFTPIGLYPLMNTPGQKLVWRGNRLKCVVPGGCPTSAFVKESPDGTAVLDSIGDQLSITAEGGGYTIQSKVTGHYLRSAGAAGDANVSFGTQPFSWTAISR